MRTNVKKWNGARVVALVAAGTMGSSCGGTGVPRPVTSGPQAVTSASQPVASAPPVTTDARPVTAVPPPVASAPPPVASAPPPVTTARPGPPPPTCLVLSVGAAKGLAHLGAIAAVREAGVHIDCVVGTSMGSLVGALYATAPNEDTTSRYQQIAINYRDAIGLLEGISMYVTGHVDHVPLEVALDRVLPRIAPGDATLPFESAFQMPLGSGLEVMDAPHAPIAALVARSIANPLIFHDVGVRVGAALDPGADSLAAVPVDLACRRFPGSRLLVINVTGHEAVWGRSMACPVTEIRFDPPGDPSAMDPIADPRAFAHVIEAGHDAVATVLRGGLHFETGASRPDPQVQLVSAESTRLERAVFEFMRMNGLAFAGALIATTHPTGSDARLTGYFIARAVDAPLVVVHLTVGWSGTIFPYTTFFEWIVRPGGSTGRVVHDGATIPIDDAHTQGLISFLARQGEALAARR